MFPYYTLAEVTEKLGMSVSQILRLAVSGDIVLSVLENYPRNYAPYVVADLAMLPLCVGCKRKSWLPNKAFQPNCLTQLCVVKQPAELGVMPHPRG